MINKNHNQLKNEIESNQKNYEKLIDEAANEITRFVEKAITATYPIYHELFSRAWTFKHIKSINCFNPWKTFIFKIINLSFRKGGIFYFWFFGIINIYSELEEDVQIQ